MKIPRLFVEIPQLCPLIPRKIKFIPQHFVEIPQPGNSPRFFPADSRIIEYKKAPIRIESELFNIISMERSQYVCVVLCHLNMF